MYNNDNELVHYGVLGMKWGVRRYQNKDGTLTAAGKIRAKRLEKAIAANDRDVADLKKNGYDKEADAVKNVGDKNRKRLAEMQKQQSTEEAHSSKSVKSMSDAELRSRLNRLQMETQYSKLSKSDVNKGKKYLDTFIKAGTTVATVTSTTLTIYNNVDKIKDIIKGS